MKIAIHCVEVEGFQWEEEVLEGVCSPLMEVVEILQADSLNVETIVVANSYPEDAHFDMDHAADVDSAVGVDVGVGIVAVVAAVTDFAVIAGIVAHTTVVYIVLALDPNLTRRKSPNQCFLPCPFLGVPQPSNQAIHCSTTQYQGHSWILKDQNRKKEEGPYYLFATGPFDVTASNYHCL